jgi:hypothetical protein
MGKTPKPDQDPKARKRGKKLELNKETVQELNDEQLEDVAGGLLGTNGGHCKEMTYQPACESGAPECIYLSRLFTCGCPATQVYCP